MAQANTAPGELAVVVGGGVVGAMCAWYLTEAGYRVTIVDRDRFGAACSHGNCGYICPSHILPLCQPGAITKTMRAMLKRNSPFAIKPRASRAWASWFWNFARRCNERDMLETANGLHSILQASLGLYRALIKDEEIDCEWEERGLLFVHDSAKGFEEYAATDRLLRERFGVGATAYDGDALAKLEPALKPGLAGAWHYEDDCHLRPDKLMDGLRTRLESRGVSFVEGAHVSGFVHENGAARAVRTPNGEIEADHIIVATGALTPRLNDDLGFKIPIEPGKGYSITTSRPAVMPKHPMVFEDSHVAITPMQSGFRIGSTMEFAGYDTRIHPKRLRLLTDAAKEHLREPMGATVEEEWYGWRPMVWDGKPIIDRSPASPNVWVAAGHSMLGLSQATGTGRLIADMLSGSTPHIDPAPFAASRFL